MATLENIRKRGPLVAAVVGFALLAFVLGDFLTSSTSIFSANRNEVAQIDGKSVPIQEYQSSINELTAIYKTRSRSASIDERVTEQIQKQTWEELLNKYIMGSEYNTLGIDVSSQELFDMVQGKNPDPIIKQWFGNPRTGQFDPNFVIQFLKNKDQDPSGESQMIWRFIENQIYNRRLSQKYSTLIAKGLYTTSEETKDAATAENKEVGFEYVVKKFSSIPDSLVQVSQKEIANYYKEHKEDYKQDEARNLAYTVFNVRPSGEDRKSTKSWVEGFRKDLIKTKSKEEMKNLLKANSDVPYDRKHYTDSELTKHLKGLFNAKVGFVSPIYLEGETYRIAKLMEKKELPDSVKARHIIIRPNDKITMAKAEATIDSLKKLIDGGADFAELAKKHSTDGAAAKGGDLGWFKEMAMVEDFSNVCFNAKKGDVEKVKTQFGVHLVEITDLGKATPKVQVAILGRKIEPGTKTYRTIYTKASQFAGENRTTEDFEKAIKDKKLRKSIISNLKPMDTPSSNRALNTMESPRQLVRWAYQAKEGEVSKVFEMGDKFIIATLTDIREKGYSSLSKAKNEISRRIRKEKKGEILAKQFNEAGGTITNISKKLNLKIEKADKVNFASITIPKAGLEPAVVGIATNLKKGSVSQPVVGNNGVYVVKVTSTQNKKTPTTINSAKQKLESDYRMRSTYLPSRVIRNSTEIEDFRPRFF